MHKFTKILAVIDPDAKEQKSLTRAILLASKTGASVTAFLTIYDFSYELTTMLSTDERECMRQAVVDDRTEWLTKIVEDAPNTANLCLDLKVVWHNRPFESILYEVLDNNYDLIVKGTNQHDTLTSVIFTPTDWHILRKSPVPVLLVKEHAWQDNEQIIAALNIGSQDAEHISLNQKITDSAIYFAELLKGQVHLVNSFPGTPVNIAIEIPEFNPQDYNKAIEQHHKKAMAEHAEKHHLAPENSHVKEGLPEEVIQQVAASIDAELVIIGTVGRTGISATLIGNTAEHVIDVLNCDVLAIKPNGFKCPLSR